MWKLPDCTTIAVLSYLPLEDLARISCVNRELHALTISPQAIELLLERDLFLPASYNLPEGPFHIPTLTQGRLIRTVRQMNADRVEFTGFATNGGVDEDNPAFWLRQVFHRGNHSYCTQENVFNVNVAGVLTATQVTPDSEELEESLRARLEVVTGYLGRGFRHRIRDAIDDTDHPRQFIYDILAQIASSAPNLLCRPDEAVSDAIASVGKVLKARSNYVPGFASLQKRTDDHLLLEEDINKVSFPCEQLAFLSGVSVSRKGGFTCPVSTMMVFSSLEYVPVNDPEFEVYNNLKTTREVAALVDANPTVPSVYQQTIQEDREVIEFRGKAGQRLQPLIWLRFSSATGEPKKLCISFTQKFPCVYLYLKLICPEDRRLERHWEHEFLNIDIKYAQAWGQVIKVNLQKDQRE